MKMNFVLIGVVLLFLNIPSLFGNEKFLSGALDEDKAMKELNNRMTEIKDKQKGSNVFSKKEIKKTQNTIERIDKVRNENIGGAINKLKKTVEDKNTDKDLGKYYDGAKNEYDKAARKMHVIMEKQIKDLVEKRDEIDLFQRQKKLFEETKAFNQDLVTKNKKANEKDLDDVAAMSEKQVAIRQETEHKILVKLMTEANNGLQGMNFPTAIQKMREILDIWAKQLNMDDSQGSDNDEALKKIKDFENKLENSQGMSDENWQDLAVEISELGQSLDSDGDDQNQQNPEGGEQPEQGDQGEQGDQTQANNQGDHNQQPGDQQNPDGEEQGDQGDQQQAATPGEQQAEGGTPPPPGSKCCR